MTITPGTAVRTQAQLAELADVSQKTVNRALAGHVDVSPATRARVIRLAREYNYRPNTAARAMRKGRFGAAALVISTKWESRYVTQDMLLGIDSILQENDMHLSIAPLDDTSLASDDYMPRILREWSCDGLLMSYTQAMPPHMLELIRACDIPTVWLNTKLDHDCVYPDDFDAGRRLTEYLLQAGRRRVAYVDYSHYADRLDEAHYSATDRFEGYAAAMRKAALPPRRIGDRAYFGAKDFSREAITAASAEWLRREDRPEAVVCYGGEAYPVMVAARELGIAVPQELTVTTFGEKPLDTMGLRIPTMVDDHGKLGKAGAELLIDRITSGDPLPTRTVPFRLKQT